MKHSETVAIAIDKIWKNYDKEQMWEGYELLRQAAEKGDADACCYLGRCHLGEEFVWCGAEFPVDEELASRLIKESVRLGSADGVLCALRTGNLSPAVRKTMPFASLEEAFMTVQQQAQKGDAFSQYMVWWETSCSMAIILLFVAMKKAASIILKMNITLLLIP